MKVYAISDLHLCAEQGKTMDMFGEHWVGHFDKIKKDWHDKVRSDDVVLISGDISWGMKLSEAAGDLKQICELPGIKIMIKGNHDFWHGSLSKTRSVLFNNTYFLQNDSVEVGEFVFAGSRGWKQRTDSDFTEDDEKIYHHEIARLSLSLKTVPEGKRFIGMMHYPPFDAGRKESEFTRAFLEAGAETVVYGHVHGRALHSPDYEDFVIGNTRFIETSCDYLGFKLRLIAQGE